MSAEFPGFDQTNGVPPKVYRTSFAGRLIFAVLGMALGIAGVTGVGHLLAGGRSATANGMPFLLLLCLPLLFLGIYVALSAARSRIVLHLDAIEMHGAMSMNRLARHEIKGIRRIKGRGGTTVQLIPADPGRKKISISPEWKTDQAFRTWISGLPDLDAQDRKADEAEVAADPLLGSTPEERTRRNAQAKKTAGYLQAAAIAIAIWAFIYPHPYRLAIGLTAALPCVAIVLMLLSEGVYRINLSRTGVRPALALAFIVPAAALAVHVPMDFHLLDWQSPLPYAVAGAAAFGGLMALADRTLRSKTKALLLYAAVMAAYGYGAGALANAMFDTSGTQTFETLVIGKRVVSGKSRTYHLVIAPWGPHAASEDIQVPRSFYDQAQQGEPVCVFLRQGALHMPWYVVGMCNGR